MATSEMIQAYTDKFTREHMPEILNSDFELILILL